MYFLVVLKISKFCIAVEEYTIVNKKETYNLCFEKLKQLISKEKFKPRSRFKHRTSSLGLYQLAYPGSMERNFSLKSNDKLSQLYQDS